MDYSTLSDIPLELPPQPALLGARRLLFGNPVARLVATQYAALADVRRSQAKTARSLSLANAEATNVSGFGSGYGYENEIREVEVALAYKKEIDDGFPPPSDSRQLYEHADQVLSRLLVSRPVERVIDFGVSYAYTDARLAQTHRGVQFVGVDRSVLTKALNEHAFQSAGDNLAFVASDIFAYLESGAPRSALWHMRTGVLLPKSFLAMLYAAAVRAGVEHICLFEPIGLSRQTMQPYRFSDMDQPSVALRDGMYIHNYTGLLTNAGFTVQRADLIKMDHPHKDVKILSITASR